MSRLRQEASPGRGGQLLTFPLIDGPLVIDPARYPAAIGAVAAAMDDGFDAWLGRVEAALVDLDCLDLDRARAAFDAGESAADYALQLFTWGASA